MKRKLIFSILILGCAAFVLAVNPALIEPVTVTGHSYDMGLFPQILDDDAAYARYNNGVMVTGAFQVKSTGIRPLTKSEYTDILARQRLLYETASEAKAFDCNAECKNLSVQWIGEGSYSARLMWDKAQRVTSYLHNNSSDVAIRESLCPVHVRAEANRALSFVEHMYVRLTLGSARWSASFSHQLAYQVYPGHKAWVQFVPNMINVFGHGNAKCIDLYIPDLSDGLYEILSTPLATPSDPLFMACEAPPHASSCWSYLTPRRLDH